MKGVVEAVLTEIRAEDVRFEACSDNPSYHPGRCATVWCGEQYIGVFGQKADGTPFQIGIKDPHDTAAVIGYLYIPSGFVAVSGNYERFFREEGKLYHHILDPETGWPVDNGLSSVAVYAQNGSAADALSTALYVMGLEEGMAFYESGQVQFEAVFVTEDNRIIPTPGLLENGMLEITTEDYVLTAN